MKVVVLGIGNPILTDDGAGIKIARKLKENIPELEVIETCEAGISILDHVVGYDKLILIDSIKTEHGQSGEIYKLELEELKPGTGFDSFHGLDIATAFKLGQRLGCIMPQHVSVYAVEVKDNTTFGEKCTRELEERIPFLVKQIIEEEKL